MITIKKVEIEPVLLTIANFTIPKEGETQKLVGGLLTEQLTLGAKRKLQKIHKETTALYFEYVKELQEVTLACGEDKEKLQKEMSELLDEEVTINADPVDFAVLENIETKAIYSLEVLEKITR